MKKFILLLAAMIAVNAYAQKAAEAPERKNWNRGSLYGNVESVTVNKYNFNVLLGEYDVIDQETYKFDKNGDVIEYTFAEDNDGIVKYEYVYDENRNVVAWIGYNSEGKRAGGYIYTYNEQGRVVDEIFYEDPDLNICTYKLVRSYNDRGLLMGGIYYNNAGEIIGKYSFTYDHKGQRIKEVYEDETHIFGYDDNGNRTSQAAYLPDGTLKNTTQISFDDKGNSINEKWYDGEGVLYSDYIAQYNDAGLQIASFLLDGEGNVIQESYTKYDEYGNIIENHVSKESEFQTRYFYKYDEKGREVEQNVKVYTFENKFVSFYDSQDNKILEEIYEYVVDGGMILTKKEVYEIKYRE